MINVTDDWVGVAINFSTKGEEICVRQSERENPICGAHVDLKNVLPGEKLEFSSTLDGDIIWVYEAGNGKEIRKSGVAGQYSNKYDSLIEETSERYGVDSVLPLSMMQAESSVNPVEISEEGAMGLMQLMPDTGKEKCGLKGDDFFDPEKNINCGVKIISQLLERYKNDRERVNLTIAAYIHGENGIDELLEKHGSYNNLFRHLGPKTQKYIYDVNEKKKFIEDRRKEEKGQSLARLSFINLYCINIFIYVLCIYEEIFCI
jgi:soluble lytic murein transglycosylase-like protein